LEGVDVVDNRRGDAFPTRREYLQKQGAEQLLRRDPPKPPVEFAQNLAQKPPNLPQRMFFGTRASGEM
jgi:hypothetical protein